MKKEYVCRTTGDGRQHSNSPVGSPIDTKEYFYR